MHLVRSIALSTTLAILCSCGKGPATGSGSGAAPSAGAPAAGAPAAPGAASDVNATSVSLDFTGNYKKGDNGTDEYPVFKVTNNSTRKLFFIKAWHYYYDKDKKQLGRQYAERTVGSIEPGKSDEMSFGWEKAKQPAGTDKVEAVFVGGNFFDHVEFKGDVPTLAPDQRPMKGG